MDNERFEWIMARTLEAEGGLADDPVDPGGATKWGISSRYHPEEVKGIQSWSDAKSFYRVKYYNVKIYETPDMPLVVATKLFLFAINVSERQALIELQEALGFCGHQVSIDGEFGPETRRAIRYTDPRQLESSLAAKMWGYYLERIARNPAKAKFAAGWKKRLRA